MPGGTNKIGSKNIGARGRGRPKGAPNKVTAAVKDMIIQALANKGGIEYLEKQADENPTAFLTLVGKVIPLQLGGDPNNPLVHEIRRSFVDVTR